MVDFDYPKSDSRALQVQDIQGSYLGKLVADDLAAHPGWDT